MPDAQHSSGTRPIALFGYLGARNIGDDLMLMGLLGAIGDAAGRITILAKEPRDVQLPPGVAPQIVRATATAFLKLLFQRAIFVRVGGTSFHDEYAERSMVRNYLKLALMFIAPCLVGSSSAAVGIGAAAPTRRSTRLLRGLALLGTRLTITRDPASSDRLRAVGTRRRVITGVDLATLLQSASNAGGDPAVLGLSALDLGPYFGERTDQRAFWSALARDAIKAVGQVTEVRLFPFKDGMPESDVGICADLAADLQAEGVKVRICGRENGLGEVLAEIQGCGHFLATRYHAGLLAVAANARVCLVRYNDKIDSIATDFAIPAACIVVPYRARDALPCFASPQPTTGFVERRETLTAGIKEILTW